MKEFLEGSAAFAAGIIIVGSAVLSYDVYRLGAVQVARTHPWTAAGVVAALVYFIADFFVWRLVR